MMYFRRVWWGLAPVIHKGIKLIMITLIGLVFCPSLVDNNRRYVLYIHTHTHTHIHTYLYRYLIHMCLYIYVYIHICSVSLGNPNSYPKEMKIHLNKRTYMNFQSTITYNMHKVETTQPNIHQLVNK